MSYNMILRTTLIYIKGIFKTLHFNMPYLPILLNYKNMNIYNQFNKYKYNYSFNLVSQSL